MKKLNSLVVLFGIVVGIASISHAGTPKDPVYPGASGQIFHTSIIGSSGPVQNISAVVAPITSQNTSCATCFTRIIAQLNQGATFYELDNGTTVQAFGGAFLNSNGAVGGTIALPEDHLGPLCFPVGDTVTFNVPASAVTTANNTVNWEGYTDCGGSRN